MTLESKKFPYSTCLSWTGEHKGTLTCEGKPDLHVACPPEWGGHPDIWSPEDLFVGSVEVCVMTTFLWLAERENIGLRSYTSEAKAVAQMMGKEFGIPVVEVSVRIGVASGDDIPKVEKALDEVGNWCLVSKSLKPGVNIHPEIFVE